VCLLTGFSSSVLFFFPPFFNALLGMRLEACRTQISEDTFCRKFFETLLSPVDLMNRLPGVFTLLSPDMEPSFLGSPE